MTEAVVLGCDPGTKTGLALVSFNQVNGLIQNLWSEQLEWDEACDVVRSRTLQMQRRRDSADDVQVAVALEQFQVNAKTAQMGQRGAEDAMGMMGVVRYRCRLAGIELYMNQASAAKNLVKDDALRHLRLHAPGLTHINDAMRHAVLVATKKRWLSPKLLMPSDT